MEVGFHGEYREIEVAAPPRHDRGLRGHPRRPAALNTLTLDEDDGVTTMTILVQHHDPGASRRPHRLGHGGRHAGLVQPHGGRRRRAGRQGLARRASRPVGRHPADDPPGEGAGRGAVIHGSAGSGGGELLAAAPGCGGGRRCDRRRPGRARPRSRWRRRRTAPRSAPSPTASSPTIAASAGPAAPPRSRMRR